MIALMSLLLTGCLTEGETTTDAGRQLRDYRAAVETFRADTQRDYQPVKKQVDEELAAFTRALSAQPAVADTSLSTALTAMGDLYDTHGPEILRAADLADAYFDGVEKAKPTLPTGAAATHPDYAAAKQVDADLTAWLKLIRDDITAVRFLGEHGKEFYGSFSELESIKGHHLANATLLETYALVAKRADPAIIADLPPDARAQAFDGTANDVVAPLAEIVRTVPLPPSGHFTDGRDDAVRQLERSREMFLAYGQALANLDREAAARADAIAAEEGPIMFRPGDIAAGVVGEVEHRASALDDDLAAFAAGEPYAPTTRRSSPTASATD